MWFSVLIVKDFFVIHATLFFVFSLRLRLISLAIFLSAYDLRLKFLSNHYPQLLPFLSLCLGIYDITVIMINICI